MHDDNIILFTSIGFKFGFFSRSKALIPAIIGVATEVPLSLVYPFPLAHEEISTDGATRSGLNLEKAGPREEN